MEKSIWYAIGILWAGLCLISSASAVDVDAEKHNGYISKILVVTHFQNGNQDIPLFKFDTVTSAGKHMVCQQYVKLVHSAPGNEEAITICEFCG